MLKNLNPTSIKFLKKHDIIISGDIFDENNRQKYVSTIVTLNDIKPNSIQYNTINELITYKFIPYSDVKDLIIKRFGLINDKQKIKYWLARGWDEHESNQRVIKLDLPSIQNNLNMSIRDKIRAVLAYTSDDNFESYKNMDIFEVSSRMKDRYRTKGSAYKHIQRLFYFDKRFPYYYIDRGFTIRQTYDIMYKLIANNQLEAFVELLDQCFGNINRDNIKYINDMLVVTCYNFMMSKQVLINRAKIYKLQDNNGIEDYRYWLYRGWPEEYSIEKAKVIHRERSIRASNISRDKLKSGSDEYVANRLSKLSNNVNYWLKQGYSEEQAKIAVSERQSTFSLAKCIEKHGPTKGLEVFNVRQEKWQNSLKDKSPEEIARINRDKGKYGGIVLLKMINGLISRYEPCLIYYIKIEYDGIVYYKIGITKSTVQSRFADAYKDDTIKIDVIFEERSTYLNCYVVEQFILKSFNIFRTSIRYKPIKTTECFTIDIGVTADVVRQMLNT